MSNRYNDGGNFITPYNERREAVNIGASPIVEGEVMRIDEPIGLMGGATEQTSGQDRAVALVIRLAPFSVTWLVLSVGVAWAASMGWVWAMLFWGGLTSVTYGWMMRTDYDYSASGLVRHKVDTLADLKELEMRQAHELRSKWLDANIRQMERGYDATERLTGSGVAGGRALEDGERGA